MLLMLEYHARMQKLQKMLAAIRHSNTKPKKLLLNTHPWRTPRWMSNSPFLPFARSKATVKSDSDVVKRHVPLVLPTKPASWLWNIQIDHQQRHALLQCMVRHDVRREYDVCCKQTFFNASVLEKSMLLLLRLRIIQDIFDATKHKMQTKNM